MNREKIKVLIVDDSAISRQLLSKIISADPALEVIGAAADPYIAAAKMSIQAPDVILLDHYMPRMDGLTFLRKIMAQHPIPVVFITDDAGKGSASAIKAQELGAFEVLPKEILADESTVLRLKICEIVKAASASTPKKRVFEAQTVKPRLSADAVLQ